MRIPLWEKIRPRLGGDNIRFRHKIMLGVGVTVFVTLLSGVNAITNIRQIGKSVSFSAEAASPLLIGVISLSESSQKLHAVFGPVMTNCSGLEGAERYLVTASQYQAVKLQELRGLAAKVNALKELDRFDFSGTKKFRTQAALLGVCRNYNLAKSRVAGSSLAISDTISDFNIKIAVDGISLDQKFAKRNLVDAGSQRLLPRTSADSRKSLDVQTQSFWPTLRDLYRLRYLTSEISPVSLVQAHLKTHFDIDKGRQAFRTKIDTIRGIFQSDRAYFEQVGQLQEFDAKAELLNRIEYYMFSAGERSFFSNLESLVDFEHQRDGLVDRFQREEGQYAVALLNFMDVAHRIDRNAQIRTESDAYNATWQIAVAMLMAILIAIVITAFFRRNVTEPLEKLTDNLRMLQVDGPDSERPVEGTLLARSDEIGDVAKQFAGTFHELVAARRELQEANRAELRTERDRLNGAIENIPQGLYMLDAEGQIVVVNGRLSQMFNLDPAMQLAGLTVQEFSLLCNVHGAGTKAIRLLSNAVSRSEAGAFDPVQHLVELVDGRTMQMISMPLPDGGLVVTYEDITERQAAERKIGHLAMHDGLTGLANRTYFRNHIDQWLERHGREDSGAMLFLDLDRFKIVNDTLGHPTGDALLVEVARRIAANVDCSAFAARLGGDEFGIFLSNIGSPNEISIVAERLLARISEPYDIESHHLVIGTSIGVAIAPKDGRNANELSKNADLALYRAKQDGKGQFRFFEPEMDRRMRDWHELEHDLREALASRQFELYYQPLVNLATSEITAFEALLRWHRPQHGYISPADFIPVAEEAGLMNEIGAWVLKEACDAAAGWPGNIKVAVNISPLQFSGNSLANDVLSALTKSQLRPDRLMLEITEGVFLNDTEETMAQLNTLESAGIHFAMDDFGTGYSSLSYLRKFRFDKIKIDQSFVRGLCDNPESEAIVRAVINLCHDLGMETVAEGVETPEQAARLREIGCEIGQGYLFGRPTPRHDAVALLEGARRKIA